MKKLSDNIIIFFLVSHCFLGFCTKREKKEPDYSILYFLTSIGKVETTQNSCTDEYWRTLHPDSAGIHIFLADSLGQKDLGCVGVYTLDKYSRIFNANGDLITTTSISQTNPNTPLQCRVGPAGPPVPTSWYKQDLQNARKATFVFKHTIAQNPSPLSSNMDNFLKYAAGDILYCCEAVRPYACFKLEIK